jgi:UDP-2,3-diacylglucosamine hydrolase
MKSYFISDTHLGSLALANGRDIEKRLVAWLDSVKHDCDKLFMLGDMIDFWYEYKYVVPKGYVRFFGKIAEFTDAGIPVYWFTGNHDIWLYNYVQEELGVTVVKGNMEISLYGNKILMGHGDGLGDPNINFQIIRKIFHNKFCQSLFSALNPSIGMSFGLNWAKNSRLKRGSEPEKYKGEDKEHLIIFSKQHAANAGEDAPDLYIFGHRHILLDMFITKKSRIVILGEWFHHYSYGVLDENGFNLISLED